VIRLNWDPLETDVGSAHAAAAQSEIALHLNVLPNGESKSLTRHTLESQHTVSAAKQFTNEDGRTLTQYMDVSTLQILAEGRLAKTNFKAARVG
jgi:hypothetical protein